MSYENAPATKMLATNCACCGPAAGRRAERRGGIGPHCRKRHGFSTPDAGADWDKLTAVLPSIEKHAPGVAFDLRARFINSALGTLDNSEVARVCCNLLTANIALDVDAPAASPMAHAIWVLGFRKLAEIIITRRMGGISIKRDAASNRYVVVSPYSTKFLAVRGSIGGCLWSKKLKAHTVPATDDHRKRLWAAVTRAYPAGTLVVGDRGVAATK